MNLFYGLLLILFNLLFSTLSSDGFTFQVDEVQQNKVALPTAPFKTIAQNKLDKLIFATPQEHDKKEIAPTRLNGFVETIHIAYDQHRPLVLSPDDVWLTICQAFGNHIAVTADEQKENLVSTSAPDTISVFIRDLAQDNQAGWEQLVQGFNDSLTLHLNHDPVSLVNQKFSTTTPVIATAYQITLMDAVKSYFSFEGGSGCGIPEITLLGTPTDWQKIYDELDQFDAYGMEFWTKELKPVIREFINASEGKPNVEFWKAIYKHESFYGAVSVTGWIHKFFPYLRDDINTETDVWDRETQFKKTYYRNPFLKGNDHLLSDISTFDFPKGYVSVPFVWTEYRPKTKEYIKHELELNAGFLGIDQGSDLSLQPFISWVITQANGKQPEFIRWDWESEDDTTITHSQPLWWPGVIDEVEELPIYDPENNSNYETGIAALTSELKQAGFNSSGASSIIIVSCHDGSTLLREVQGPLKKNEANLRNYFAVQKKQWKPAQTSPRMIPFIKGLLPANYKIELKL
ncbi:MAG: hypothetical protein Crog4KO_24550 [Crocinitomicaceae bacterium]